jgi:putative DNA primase/helicase
MSVDLTPGEIRTYFQTRVPALKKQQNGELRAPCPVHHGKRDSFSVNIETGLSNCHSECGRGWDVIGLEQELKGCDFKAALATVEHIVGRTNGNGLGFMREWRGVKKLLDRGFSIVATYDFVDEHGRLLFKCDRYEKPGEPKEFRPRQPDGNGGWLGNIQGVRRVLYRLPKLEAAEVVWIAEGEECVHSLEDLGLVATCNPMGARKWASEYSDALEA